MVLILRDLNDPSPPSRLELRVMRHFITCFALAGALLAPCAASSAWAQHETAQDLLDGERAYRDRGCANCHGPNGDLIPGINFSAGQFRRPMTDADLSRIIRQGIPKIGRASCRERV